MVGKKVFWKSRFGFYMAAIGSAVGLGNLWRFPYVVGDNGGGAFVLLYIMLAMLVGLPLLIGELIIGKYSRQNILMATQAIHQSERTFPWYWIGRFSVLMSIVVLSYYAVVSGWVLHFFTQFTLGFFNQQTLLEKGRFDILMSNGGLQMGLASVHLLLVIVIALKGFQEGFEKWLSYVMPVFFVLLILLGIKSISLPSAADALRFLLYPDFSRLNSGSLLQALGHVCFTLSIGFGTMVTFGSYLRDGDHIPTAGLRVTLVDTALSIMAGILLFPIVFLAPGIRWSDPGLLFEALPQFFTQISNGGVFGWAFFLCLYLAALAASIGLVEVITANLTDKFKLPRSTVVWLVGGATLIIGLLPSLSSSIFSKIRIGDKSLLEILDFTLINILLPLIALGVSLIIGKGISRAEKEKYFVDLEKIESVALFPYWTFAIRWVVPGVITISFIAFILSLLIRN